MRHQIHYRRFLLMLVMLSAATFALAQTANDYWLAADKALAAGDTDSTFYYLNLFREKFGRQYAYAYTTFLTEEDYRTLHNDARWTAFMDSMRTYKHGIFKCLYITINSPIRYTKRFSHILNGIISVSSHHFH